MKYLLDTCIMSEILKPRPNLAVARRLAGTARERLYTSTICVAELRVWGRHSGNPGARWKRVEESILSHLTILDLDVPAAIVAGDLVFDLARSGATPSALDVLIGATALANGLTLVTRNAGDFARLPGLQIEDWFD